jgi:phage/plasmid-like protein (TIGR03299 family)
MAHEVESMFWHGSGELPWHGLGTEIPADKRLNVKEALVAAGCDWEVGKIPLMVATDETWTTEPDDEGNTVVSTIPQPLRGKRVVAFSTYRKTDNSILGEHVGVRYTPLQNHKAFEWFQPFLDRGECEFHTAGSLSNGKTVWVLAKINRAPMEILANDTVAKFILLSNSHDGTKAAKLGFTPIRVVCANTLAMAEASGRSKLLKVRHSKNVETTLDAVRETVDVWNARFEATAEQYRYLASKGVNEADLKKYVQLILSKKEEVEADEPHTRLANTMNRIFELVENPKGGKTGPTSWWSAYNAFTEYLSYERSRNASNRLRELWYGSAVLVNDRALELALKMAG